MIDISRNLRALVVLVKLLPLLVKLRRDRREWVRKEGENVDVSRFKRNGQKLLDTFVSLGPVYIKLGQWLSSRADILPEPYMDELAKLQDDVPAAPFEKVVPIIENELGSINSRFEEFDSEVLSGASLGQVYRAKAKGKDVIVKAKRPGIEHRVQEDLAILKKILPIGMRFVDHNLRFSVRGMLNQFVETIKEEMDYRIEANNLNAIKENMKKYSNLIIPSVLDDYSGKDVLTLDYIPGTKITNVEALDELGLDRQKLVVDVHKLFFTMLLHHSVFHADPHPGNISVTKNGYLILYDFGMVGRIDDDTRLKLVRLYLSLIDKDASRTVTAMGELGMLTMDYNRTVMERGIDLTIKSLHGKKVDNMEVQAFMEIANKTMSKFPFVLPKHLSLYMRMASLLEGIYITHKVEFRFISVLKKILEEENLIKDAYVEEIRDGFRRISKSLEATVMLAPELKRYLDENKSINYRDQGRSISANALLPSSILSASVFLGSSFLYSHNETAGIAGFIVSGMIMAVSLVLKK